MRDPEELDGVRIEFLGVADKEDLVGYIKYMREERAAWQEAQQKAMESRQRHIESAEHLEGRTTYLERQLEVTEKKLEMQRILTERLRNWLTDAATDVNVLKQKVHALLECMTEEDPRIAYFERVAAEAEEEAKFDEVANYS